MEPSISENIENFHQLTEINEEVQILSHRLNEFEIKLDRSDKIVRDLIRDIRTHLSMLRQSVEVAKENQNVENLQIPSLRW